MNAPQYYVKHTRHVLFLLNSWYIHSPLDLRGLCIHLNQDEGQWIITHYDGCLWISYEVGWTELAQGTVKLWQSILSITLT